MSSLPKIVKSFAVVDDRPREPVNLVELQAQRTVLKSRALRQAAGYYPVQSQPVSEEQLYLDKLNRVKVEVAEAEARLRSMNRELEEAREQSEQIQMLLHAREAEGTPEEQANAILLGAREEADALLNQARADAHQMKEDARESGFVEGLQAGTAQAKEELYADINPKLKDLREMMESLSGYREEFVRQNETDLVELVLEVAKKVIGREIKEDHAAIAGMLSEVLEENRREEYIKIILSPDLMPVEAKAAEEVRQIILERGSHLDIHVDDLAGEQTVMVETAKGMTDLSVGTQLENIREAMLQ